MHPWFLCRKFRLLICSLMVLESESTRLGAIWRNMVGIFIFFVAPGFVVVPYAISGLWNPSIGLDEDGNPIKSVSLVMIIAWELGCFLAFRAAVTPWCMPAPLRRIAQEFKKAEDFYETTEIRGVNIKAAFNDDLLERTDIYLEAAKKASAEEIALSALADITWKKGPGYLHKKVSDRLKELEEQLAPDRLLNLSLGARYSG